MANSAAQSAPAEGDFSPASSRWRRLELVAGLLVIIAVFCWLQLSTPGICGGDFDGYYHIKWSQLLGEGLQHGKFPPTFEWLPLTTLNPAHYADQHFLFHLLLIPFISVGDLRLAAKIAAAFFGAAAVCSVYWLIWRYRIRYPLLWLLALLGCSWIFFYRIDMTKAESLSLLFLVVGTVLLLERKFIWLLPTAFLFTWAYNLFILLGLEVALWVVVLWWSERRLHWKPLLWTGLGMVMGFVINPYFPRNLHLFLEHLVAKAGPMAADVGLEWYSLGSWDFLKASLLAAPATIVGYIGFGYVLSLSRGDRMRAQRPLYFLLLSTALLLMAIRSRRFMEYWPPFAILFGAFALQGALTASSRNDALDPFAAEPGAGQARPGKDNAGWKIFELAPLALGLAAICSYNLHFVQAVTRSTNSDPDIYATGAAWLRTHVPPRTLIYDLNFSDFPKLFFYDSVHTYVTGLDPQYLHNLHPELEELDLRLRAQQEPNPAAAIRLAFAKAGAPPVSYLFVGSVPDGPSPEWFNYIQSGGFEVVYQDAECAVLRIRSQ
jgi:hypothetical protein